MKRHMKDMVALRQQCSLSPVTPVTRDAAMALYSTSSHHPAAIVVIFSLVFF